MGCTFDLDYSPEFCFQMSFLLLPPVPQHPILLPVENLFLNILFHTPVDELKNHEHDWP